MMSSLTQYQFTQAQLDYVESHNNFTLRNMLDVIEWMQSLPPAQSAKVASLALAQQVALWKCTDEVRREFFVGGFGSPLTAFLQDLFS